MCFDLQDIRAVPRNSMKSLHLYFVKNKSMWSFFWSVFSVFSLNIEIYSLSPHNQSEYLKILTSFKILTCVLKHFSLRFIYPTTPKNQKKVKKLLPHTLTSSNPVSVLNEVGLTSW